MTCVRWGILSTANIARKNWRALTIAENASLVAVASRDKTKAQRFIDECNAQFPSKEPVDAVESYEAILNRDDIDAVYIPLPTGLRKEWILAAIEAGKHVLSEKPVAINMSDMKEIADLAKKQNVQFMDGVMFAHSLRYEALLKFLYCDNGVGTVRRIATNFSFLGGSDFQASNIRSNATHEPLGCLGDLGWYCVRFILAAKNWKLPSAVIGRTLHAYGTTPGEQVPSEFSGDLFFSDGTSANFFCSFLIEHQQWAHISGDKGNVFIDDFVLPFHGNQTRFYSNAANFNVNGCDFRMESNRQEHTVEEVSEGHPSAQEVNLFRTFSEFVLQRSADYRWLDKSVATQRVVSLLKDSSDAGAKLLQM